MRYSLTPDYTRGIPPDELRLGSLYLDLHNQNLGLEKFRFEYIEKMYVPTCDYWSFACFGAQYAGSYTIV
ncbi:hypothetical protein F4782DRAFT_492838 [Xylaria castorea]|nr:hypothetical protein F4782DRAFT_492838 [Xylaria castorea]